MYIFTIFIAAHVKIFLNESWTVTLKRVAIVALESRHFRQKSFKTHSVRSTFLDKVFDLDYETSASNNLDKLVRPFALSPKHLQTWCRKQAMLYVKRYGITMLELWKISISWIYLPLIILCSITDRSYAAYAMQPTCWPSTGRFGVMDPCCRLMHNPYTFQKLLLFCAQVDICKAVYNTCKTFACNLSNCMPDRRVL